MLVPRSKSHGLLLTGGLATVAVVDDKVHLAAWLARLEQVSKRNDYRQYVSFC